MDQNRPPRKGSRPDGQSRGPRSSGPAGPRPTGPGDRRPSGPGGGRRPASQGGPRPGSGGPGGRRASGPGGPRPNDDRPRRPRRTSHPTPKDHGDPGEDRIQKVLAHAGIGSRRACEELILAGRVTVNGKVVKELGSKCDPLGAGVAVDGEKILTEKPVYFAVYKPKGYVSTNADPSGRPRVLDLLPEISQRVYTVGRLDEMSNGLIILTNDGTLAHKLAHPKYGVEKLYRVVCAGAPSQEVLNQLTEGIWLAEGKVRAKRVRAVGKRGESTILEMVLSEGKNREVRRMLAKLGHKVMSLTRIAVGPVTIKGLSSGQFRPLTTTEVGLLRKVAAGEYIAPFAFEKRAPRAAKPRPEGMQSGPGRPTTHSNEERRPQAGNAGGRPQSGGRPPAGAGRGPQGDNRPQAGGERPAFGRRPQGEGRPQQSGGDRPQYGRKPQGDGRPQQSGGDRPQYGRRPQGEGRPQQSGGDRPAFGRRPQGDDRPQAGGRPGSDRRPKREDRPQAARHDDDDREPPVPRPKGPVVKAGQSVPRPRDLPPSQRQATGNAGGPPPRPAKPQGRRDDSERLIEPKGNDFASGRGRRVIGMEGGDNGGGSPPPPARKRAPLKSKPPRKAPGPLKPRRRRSGESD